MRPRTVLVGGLVILCVGFLAYRMVRPLTIFVVSEAFERPIEETVPTGLTSLSASACGRCHETIYQEWSESMHSQAWTDPYFQIDFVFDGSQQICLNCHTPLAAQQPDLVLGFRDREKFQPIVASNDAFDAELRDEGVTCAVCHVRDGAVIGPYGNTNAPHPTRREPAMVDGLGTCVRCHVASGERWDTFYEIPPCGTGAEMGGTDGGSMDCTACHMPAVERPLVAGGVSRHGRMHLWRGGHDPDTVRGALNVAVSLGDAQDGIRTATVGLTNTGTDHHLPTGTPDRHLSLAFRLRDQDGNILDEQDHILRRTILWRPFIVDLWDTRLVSNRRQRYTFEFQTRAKPAPAELEITVRYHLLDEARRRRIGYENQDPISYVVYQTSLPTTEPR